MTKSITPNKFAEQMQQIADQYGDDPEAVHGKMDDLMCELLESLGYEKGVGIFKQQWRWYA